jgi:hypothetical protein
MVPNGRHMVPYGSRTQQIGATGTMWEPYGSCVGHVGGGWCHIGTACAIRVVDGLREPFGAMSEADGNLWELSAPYGGHMGAMCTRWEPCVCHMGAVCEPYGSHFCHMGAKIVPTVRQMAPYGSCMRRMGAVCAIWEPYGSRVGSMGGGWHHMGVKYAIWVPYGSHLEPCGRQMAPYGRQMAPYGSCVHSMGPIWEWCHRMGAVCAVRELCAPMGAMHIIWEPYAVPFGGLMVAMCDRMGAVTSCGSHMMPFAPSGAGWERRGSCGSWEATRSFGSIAARVQLVQHWAPVSQRNAARRI